MGIRANTRRILAGLIAILFTVYYVNATMFMHCHIINGVTIVHSHFHTASHTSSSEDGGHTSSELTLIAALNALTVIGQDVAHFDFSAPVALRSVYIVAEQSPCRQSVITHFSLRAPPVFSQLS